LLPFYRNLNKVTNRRYIYGTVNDMRSLFFILFESLIYFKVEFTAQQTKVHTINHKKF